MAFGNLSLRSCNPARIDLKPFLKDSVSQKARNMTEYTKYIMQENRKFELHNQNHKQVSELTLG